MSGLCDSSNPIEAYLWAAGRYLRRHLLESAVEQRLAEAREHLSTRAEELIAGGMGPEQARSTAVSAFGPVKEWARSIAEAAYTNPKATIARWIAAVASSLVIVIVLAAMVIQALRPLNPMLVVYWSNSLVALCFCILAVAALRARRAQPLLIGIVGAVATAGAFVYFGSSIVTAPDHGERWFRTDVAVLTNGLDREIADNRAEIALLSLGINTYCQPGSPASDSAVPPTLRTSTGAYVTPAPFQAAGIVTTRPIWGENDVPALVYVETNAHYWARPSLGDTQPMLSAFKTYTPSQMKTYETSLTRVDTGLRIKKAAPYCTAATIAQARFVWQASGPTWLCIQKETLADRVQMMAQMRSVAAQPVVFSGVDGFAWASLVMIYALGALLLDLVAAHLGRLIFRSGRPGRTIIG